MRKPVVLQASALLRAGGFDFVEVEHEFPIVPENLVRARGQGAVVDFQERLQIVQGRGFGRDDVFVGDGEVAMLAVQVVARPVAGC